MGQYDPRTELTVSTIVRDGGSLLGGTVPIAQLIANATNKHFFQNNDGQVYVEIENVGGSATVDFLPAPSLPTDGLTVDPLSVGVTAGTLLVGPFKRSTFNQDGNGTVFINPDTSTTVKFRAYRLPSV